MATEVRLPREGSTTMTSAVITEWLVAVGDVVAVGQPLAEVDTDKVAVEIEAPVAGTVLALHADPEDEVEIGGLLVTLGDPQEQVQTTTPTPASIPQPASAPSPGMTAPPAAASAPDGPTAAPGDGPPAAPAARRRARELGIDLTTVEGSGPGGRITSADVDAAAQDGATTAPDPDLLAGLRGHRRIVAERMSRAAQGTAAVTLMTRADVSALRAAEARADWSLADQVAHAVARALQTHPALNATLTVDGIVARNRIGLAYAVDGPRGLVVPVIADAGALTLAELAQARRRLVQAARRGELTVEDLAGGTFTLTNLGPLGIEHFTPIITPDQCGVLGIGAVSTDQVPAAEGWVARHQLALSLTFDHRMVDGAHAAHFLKAISDALTAVRHP